MARGKLSGYIVASRMPGRFGHQLPDQDLAQADHNGRRWRGEGFSRVLQAGGGELHRSRHRLCCPSVDKNFLLDLKTWS